MYIFLSLKQYSTAAKKLIGWDEEYNYSTHLFLILLYSSHALLYFGCTVSPGISRHIHS